MRRLVASFAMVLLLCGGLSAVDDGFTFADFLSFLESFGKAEGDSNYDSTWDLEPDGRVGFGDFLVFVTRFGDSSGSKEPAADPAMSPFGMVHADAADTTAGFVWTKTLAEIQAWDGTSVNAVHWQDLMAQRRDAGKLEVPIALGDTWKSGDIQAIADMMRQFFEADPDVRLWELGLEENLSVRSSGNWAEHWAEVAAKFEAVQSVKDVVNPDILLGYQIAETDLTPVETLFQSEAPQHIDVLALHPYPWPDFESPEAWHDSWIEDVFAVMDSSGNALPIWYTETGAPQNDDGVDQMVAGDGVSPITGLTQDDHARFMVKLHVMAFQAGVEKVFWYNYIDRFLDSTNAEAHFGLKDHSGSPKPSYHAYAAMTRFLGDRSSSGYLEPVVGVRAYSFGQGVGSCAVVWAYPAGDSVIGLSEIETMLNTAGSQVFDLYGEELLVDDDSLSVTGSPLYVVAD